MRRTLNSIIVIAVSLLLVFAMMPMMGSFTYADTGELVVFSDLKEISKHGNVYMTADGRRILPQDLEDAGIEYGDIVTVSFLDKTIDMPVVRNFSELPSGEHLIRLQEDKTEFAVNSDDFASEYIADMAKYEDGSYAWSYKDGIEGPVEFKLVLKEKGGYIDDSGQNGLSYTDERTDYPWLSDEEFANFRVITTTGIANGNLYRTSSPVNPKHKRNIYADAALKKYGIKTVMNLSDSKADAEGYAGYSDSYYSTCNYIPLKMGMSFTTDDFRTKLAEGLRFFADNTGPYAVHCVEGKDRTGLVAALLECFMGATYDEIKSDYMVSFYNYYGVQPGEERYEKIADANIGKNLRKLLDVEDLEHADLSLEAEKYFREIGLSNEETEKLRANLGKPQPEPEKKVEKPKKAAIRSLKAGKCSLTVTMTAAPAKKGGTYYQIAYKVKGSKEWKYKTTKSVKLTVKNLKRGKKYDVKARTYKIASGRKHYGAWSKTKTSGRIK